MNLKLSTWLLVALAGGAFAAGCGSSSKSSNSTSGSQTGTTRATTPVGPTAPGEESITPGSTTTAPAPTHFTPAQVKQAVSTCKHGVQADPAIPASAKAKLERTCEKVSSGNLNALRQVAQEACVELVNASHLPSGAAKQRALAVCKVNSTVGK